VRRESFPTWSWAGWRGPLFFGQPIDVKKTRRFPIDLEINRFVSGQLKQIFATKCDSHTTGDGVCIAIRNDPIYRAARVELSGPELHLQQPLSGEEACYLVIAGVFLHFTPNFETPLSGNYQSGVYETFSFKIKGVRCLIRITSTDRWIPGQWSSDRWVLDKQKQEEWTCILIARDYLQGFILNHLMLVKMQTTNSIAERATVFELLIPLDELDILQEFQPRKRQIILA